MKKIIKLFLLVFVLIIYIDTFAQSNGGYGYGTPKNDHGNNNNGIPPPVGTQPKPSDVPDLLTTPTQPNVYQPNGTNQPDSLDSAPREYIFHDYTGNDSINTEGIQLTKDLNGISTYSKHKMNRIHSTLNRNDTLALPDSSK